MLSIDDFSENLVEYNCHRVLNTETVWINSKEARSLEEVLNCPVADESFARFFSYMPKANQCFKDIDFDLQDQRTYEAERYGGPGVGTNGGGARVGNYANLQVKGAGPNPLAHANGESRWHSYGSLNLPDAAYEAIFSTVLNELLPMGCAKVYGIVHTSKTGALHWIDSGSKTSQYSPISGALLIRERALRPAHFMRAASFAPPKSSGLMRDFHRVRSVNKKLRAKFDDNNGFIRYLGTFILSSAKQFAFALAARITHGGMTPSNISLDGRWLDLTEARFLSGGKNLGRLLPFYDEPQIVIQIVCELAHIFGKSNRVNFQVEPLIKYYQKVFKNCFAFYSLPILGMPPIDMTNISATESGTLLADSFLAVIKRSKKVVRDIDDLPDPDDPVIKYIRSLYLSLANDDSHLATLNPLLSDSGVDASSVVAAFRDVFFQSIAMVQPHEQITSARNSSIACAIKALRWACLSAYFYKKNIILQLYFTTHDKSPRHVGEYITECINYSEWIFSTATTGSITILQTDAVRITFEEARGIYLLTDNETHEFEHYADCLAFVVRTYPHFVLGKNFDPLFYLNSISGVLAKLEAQEPQLRGVGSSDCGADEMATEASQEAA